MSAEARRRRRVRTPVLAVTAVAWVALLLADPGDHGTEVGAAVHAHGAHASPAHAVQGSGHSAVLGSVAMWALMVAAMMTPLLIGPLRHVSARSLPGRRMRAMLLLGLASFAVWMLAGPVLIRVARVLSATPAPVVVALVMLGAWQLALPKQQCLNRHHRQPPIAAFGGRADLDVLRFGALHAIWCLGSCWTLMMLPLMLDSWHLLVMAAASLWMWAEMFDRPRVPKWQLRAPIRALRIVVAATPGLGSGRP